jgi:hypothetical protein
MDTNTWKRLFHETRFNVTETLYKRWQYRDTKWSEEIVANRAKISIVGPSAFTEKCLDNYMMNWYIQATALFFPQLKSVFVDKRDEDLF